MLLTISTTHQPAADLGYLLHKHPDKFQSFDLSFGQAHVFYPEVSAERATAALLLEVDPVGLVRGKSRDSSFLLDQYVNDRPYVASSLLSVAISQVFSSALAGKCRDRQALADSPIPLAAQIDVLPVRGGEPLLRQLFEPLGYDVSAARADLDERFPEWGASSYYSVTISATKRLAELLAHLYVLIPVFDNQKHYYVGQDELEKLLDKGGAWLAAHPRREAIARRYLRNQASLYRPALARIAADDPEPDELELDASEVTATESNAPNASASAAAVPASSDSPPRAAAKEESLERTVRLNDQRLAQVAATLKATRARAVLDLGCGEGKLLRELRGERQFERLVGLDVSLRVLEIAHERLRLGQLTGPDAERLQLLHGSLTYRDERLAGFDAAALVEVIEHLDPPRLAALERVVFEWARPKAVVVTTPNREYNVLWESLPAGEFRHSDHRFEWTREEFQDWATATAARHGYAVRFEPVGPEHPQYGSPTQLALFQLSPPPVQ